MKAERVKTSASLTATLATVFFVLSVAVLLIAGSFGIYFLFKTEQAAIAGEQRIIAHEAASTVGRFIQKKLSVLEGAVRLGGLSAGSKKEQRTVLQILLGLQPAFRQVVLLDSHERELSRASRLSEAASGHLVDRVGSDLFSGIKERKSYIGPVYVDEVTSEPLVVIAVPETDSFGDFLGTLMAEVNLKFMWDLVDRLDIGETGQAYVVDRRGNLIAFGDTGRVLRRENVGHLKEVGDFMRNAAPADRTGANISTGINGTTIVGTYVPLGTPDWAVVTELPVREAYQRVIRSAVISASLMLVMAVLAGLIGVYVARRLAVPILNLTETAARIAGGETGLQAAPKGPTEVVRLAGAFNHMTGQLREMLSKEEKRTHELEQEIVQRKGAEEALVRAKEDWENTFDAITDMVMVLDNEHRIVRVNKAVAQALKATKESVVGKKCYEAFHGQSHPINKCPLVETMKTLEPHTVEIGAPDMGGTFICSTSPILNGEGKLAGYTHVLKDITESKRLEAQFQQAQRLEAVGTLAGGIAHDFNNLLMGIQGRISLMLMNMDADDPHFMHISGMEEAVRRGAALTKQLLGFARGGKYEVTPTDLNELIEKSSEMLGRAKKEIRIHRKYETDIWTVEVDRGQIEQVLMNLYVNAWQAMPGGGDLYLETKNVRLDTKYTKAFNVGPGNYVKISATDTGAGMDEATRQRVFEPFFTTKEMGGGTGLGLASAYGIIKNHGGIIDLYSEPGQGATFNIYLPASKKEVSKDKEPSAALLEGTETVLLVDDEHMIMDVGRELLAALGYKVMLAANGKQAVELYEKNKDEIDIVVLDLVMPDMGGGEVYDRLKEVNPKVKVLLSSGYSIDGQANEILRRGCDGFIQKPFNMEELSEKLRGILENG